MCSKAVLASSNACSIHVRLSEQQQRHNALTISHCACFMVVNPVLCLEGKDLSLTSLSPQVAAFFLVALLL